MNVCAARPIRVVPRTLHSSFCAGPLSDAFNNTCLPAVGVPNKLNDLTTGADDDGGGGVVVVVVLVVVVGGEGGAAAPTCSRIPSSVLPENVGRERDRRERADQPHRPVGVVDAVRTERDVRRAGDRAA